MSVCGATFPSSLAGLRVTLGCSWAGDIGTSDRRNNWNFRQHFTGINKHETLTRAAPGVGWVTRLGMPLETLLKVYRAFLISKWSSSEIKKVFSPICFDCINVRSIPLIVRLFCLHGSSGSKSRAMPHDLRSVAARSSSALGFCWTRLRLQRTGA